MLHDAAWAETLQGDAELLAVDRLMVGCRVKGRDDCRPEELKFVDGNRPDFMFGAALADAAVIPTDATCAQARASDASQVSLARSPGASGFELVRQQRAIMSGWQSATGELHALTREHRDRAAPDAAYGAVHVAGGPLRPLASG